MEDRSFEGRRGERGFALILAILSLMLLTFLGLTMATTTSTELQIATNYRWSQQAVYNAEAGLEAARIVLSNSADVSTQWTAQLPPAAHDVVGPGAALGSRGPHRGPGLRAVGVRRPGGGVGYGLVLNDGAAALRERHDLRRGNPERGLHRLDPPAAARTNNAGQYSENAADNSRPRHRRGGRRPLHRGGRRVHARPPGGPRARDPLHAVAGHGGRPVRPRPAAGPGGGLAHGRELQPLREHGARPRRDARRRVRPAPASGVRHRAWSRAGHATESVAVGQ